MDNAERRERMKEAAMSLLEAAPSRRMQITNLNKALFYLDLAELLNTGHTATGTTYLALQAGPVVLGYEKRLVRALEEDGLVRQVSVGDAKPLEALRALDEFHFLSEETRARAATTARRFAAMSATQVSEFSHENPGWKMAWDAAKRLNGQGQPIDMLVALQQFSGDEDWLAAPPDDDIMIAFSDADRHRGEPW